MTSKPSSPHQLFCRETNYRMCDNMKGTKSAITMTATNPDKDYSAHPLSGINNDVTEEGPPLKVSGKCGQLGRLCGVCEGDCDDDTHCADGLVCFVRDSKTRSENIEIPGCSTNPIEFTAKDFCVDASIYQCKDSESFPVRVGSFTVSRGCEYVQIDKTNRCVEYGRYCRSTCGYCRSESHNSIDTNY